jgi:hypothetical protein
MWRVTCSEIGGSFKNHFIILAERENLKTVFAPSTRYVNSYTGSIFLLLGSGFGAREAESQTLKTDSSVSTPLMSTKSGENVGIALPLQRMCHNAERVS